MIKYLFALYLSRLQLFSMTRKSHFLPLFPPTLSPMRQSRSGDGIKGSSYFSSIIITLIDTRLKCRAVKYPLLI